MRSILRLSNSPRVPKTESLKNTLSSTKQASTPIVPTPQSSIQHSARQQQEDQQSLVIVAPPQNNLDLLLTVKPCIICSQLGRVCSFTHHNVGKRAKSTFHPRVFQLTNEGQLRNCVSSQKIPQIRAESASFIKKSNQKENRSTRIFHPPKCNRQKLIVGQRQTLNQPKVNASTYLKVSMNPQQDHKGLPERKVGSIRSQRTLKIDKKEIASLPGPRPVMDQIKQPERTTDWEDSDEEVMTVEQLRNIVATRLKQRR